MSNRLSGAWFKLVDQRGNDLGSLMVPEGVARHMENKTYSFTTTVERQSLRSIGAFSPMDSGNAISMDIRQFHIVAAQSWQKEDALMLVGIAPEGIDKEPGYRFMPSMDYIRTCIERPVDQAPASATAERAPVPPGRYLEATRNLP